MMMSGEEEKDVQAPDSSAIEAPCSLADPGDGGGDNNNNGRGGECMAMVALSASEEETKIINSNNNEDGWEAARAWLMTLPRRRNVMNNEIEDWLHHNEHILSREITTMPRQHLYRYLIGQHKLIRRADQPQSPQQQKNIQNSGIGSSGGLKCRQISVNGGLMQRGELSSEHQYGHIDGLLRDSRNSDAVERNAVQKGDLDGGEALPRNNIPGFIDGTSSELKNSDNRIEQEHGNGTTAMALTILDSGNMLRHNSEDTEHFSSMGKDKALRRYELLSKLENQLLTLISNSKQQLGVSNLSTGGVSLPSQWSAERNGVQFLEGNDGAKGRTKRKSQYSIQSQLDLASHSTVGQARLRSSADAKLGRKRKAKDNLDISVYALARSEAHGAVMASNQGTPSPVP